MIIANIAQFLKNLIQLNKPVPQGPAYLFKIKPQQLTYAP